MNSNNETVDMASPFVTVFVARSVVRKFWLAVLFLIVAVALSALIPSMLTEIGQFETFLKHTDSVNIDRLDRYIMQRKDQAILIVIFVPIFAITSLIFCIVFLISAIQSYRETFTDLSDLMAHYRLAKNDVFSDDVIASPKSAYRKIPKTSDNYSALDLPELLHTGRELLATNNYVQAFHVFKSATVRFPENHEGWWGMLCAKTEMFGKVPVSSSSRSWYSKAYALAPPKTKDLYKNTFEAWSYARRAAQKQLEEN